MILALQILGYLAAIPLLWPVGNDVVRVLLSWSGVPKSAKPPPIPTPHAMSAETTPSIGARAGRYIGFLERSLIVAGLLLSSWDIITAVVALKTVARYKELDEQISAEYFLIGSLASILWAVFVATILTAYDGTLGLHLISHSTLLPSEHGSVLQFIY
jgi:hypothetical protein